MSQYEVMQFELSSEFNGHSNPITSIAVAEHPSNTVITSSSDGKLVIWSFSQTQTVNNHTILNLTTNKTIKCHSLPIQSIDIDVNGQFAITASNDKTLKLWNLQTLKLQQVFAAHTKDISSVSLSHPFIISGSKDSTAIIWNTKGNILHKIAMSDNRMITNALIAPNRKFFIISSTNLIQIYNINAFESGITKTCVIRDRSLQNIHKIAVSFGCEYELLAVGCNHGLDYKPSNEVKLYSIANGTLIVTFYVDGLVNDMCFSQDEHWLCVAVDRFIVIYDLDKKAKIYIIDIWKNGYEYNSNLKANCVAHPLGDNIFVGCSDGVLRVWSIIRPQTKYANDSKLDANRSHLQNERFCNGFDAKNEHNADDESQFLQDLNKTMTYDLEMEKKKNNELKEEIEAMVLEIKLFEINQGKLKEKLRNYNKLLRENAKIKRDLIRREEEYKDLSEAFCDLAEKQSEMINIVSYKLWGFDNIIDWICSLNDGKYQIYARVLHKSMKKENVKGYYLDNLCNEDLRKFGIADENDMKEIMLHIKALLKTGNHRNHKRQKQCGSKSRPERFHVS